MTRVGRVTEELAWGSWAASRQDVAQLMRESADLFGEVAGAFNASLSLPQFERPFYGAEEFLENVDEREWLNTHSFRIALETERASDGLSVEITGRRDDKVELRLYGGRSLDRNALQPELRHALNRFSRPTHWLSGFVRFLGVVGGLAVAGGGLALAFIFSDELYDAGIVPFIAAFGSVFVIGPLLGGLLASAADSYASRSFPKIEFLHDDGVSLWDRRRTTRRWVIATLIALAGAAAAIVGLFSDS